MGPLIIFPAYAVGVSLSDCVFPVYVTFPPPLSLPSATLIVGPAALVGVSPYAVAQAFFWLGCGYDALHLLLLLPHLLHLLLVLRLQVRR